MNNLYILLNSMSIIMYSYNFCMLLLYEDMQINLFKLALHSVLNTGIILLDKNSYYPCLQIQAMILLFRSVLCCLFFYYRLHIISNIFICYVAMYLADIVAKHTVYTQMPLMPPMNYLDYTSKQKVLRMYSYMELIATYSMLENIHTAYSPLLAIQLSAFLISLSSNRIIHVAYAHYIYALVLWMNVFYVLNLDIMNFIVMNILCYIMFIWQYENNMNKYAGWLVIFGTYYLLQNMFLSYVKLYTDTFDITYVYICKYTIISTVLNYCHILYEKELIYPLHAITCSCNINTT